MKQKTTEIYKCDYCQKWYQIKRFAEYHEKMCSRNPANFRACHSCINCEKKETEIWSGYDDYYDSEPVNRKVNFLYCKKKEIFLYTPQNEIKGNYYHTDSGGGIFDNHPMPKDCELKNK